MMAFCLLWYFILKKGFAKLHKKKDKLKFVYPFIFINECCHLFFLTAFIFSFCWSFRGFFCFSLDNRCSYCSVIRLFRTTSTGCFLFRLLVGIVDFVEIHQFYHCHFSVVTCTVRHFDDTCITPWTIANFWSYISEQFCNRFFLSQTGEHYTPIVGCIFF